MSKQIDYVVIIERFSSQILPTCTLDIKYSNTEGWKTAIYFTPSK